MTAVPRYAKFATATLAFLEALAANKNREWFDVKSDDCLSPQFQRKVESSFKAAEPFMRFLCKSVGVPF